MPHSGLQNGAGVYLPLPRSPNKNGTGTAASTNGVVAPLEKKDEDGADNKSPKTKKKRKGSDRSEHSRELGFASTSFEDDYDYYDDYDGGRYVRRNWLSLA